MKSRYLLLLSALTLSAAVHAQEVTYPDFTEAQTILHETAKLPAPPPVRNPLSQEEVDRLVQAATTFRDQYVAKLAQAGQVIDADMAGLPADLQSAIRSDNLGPRSKASLFSSYQRSKVADGDQKILLNGFIATIQENSGLAQDQIQIAYVFKLIATKSDRINSTLDAVIAHETTVPFFLFNINVDPETCGSDAEGIRYELRRASGGQYGSSDHLPLSPVTTQFLQQLRVVCHPDGMFSRFFTEKSASYDANTHTLNLTQARAYGEDSGYVEAPELQALLQQAIRDAITVDAIDRWSNDATTVQPKN